MRSERGVSAVLVAATLIFLLGAAALAVDASGFYQRAQSQQRAADLACLAGVIELPQRPALAAETAAGYLRPNQPGLSSLPPATPATGTLGSGVATWNVGGFTVEIETPYGDRDTRMRVSILQNVGTNFGKVVGTESVDVVQEAICEVGSGLAAGADQPFGVITGFTGGLINLGKNECTLNGDNNSKCSGLAIPRHDDPEGSQFGVRTAKNFIANMVSGLNWEIDPSDPGVACAESPTGPFNEPCNKVAAVSGDEPSKLYNGLISGYNQYPPESEIGYLERDDGGPRLQWGDDEYDGHELADIAECVNPGDPSQSGSEYCPTAADSLGWDVDTVFDRVEVSEISECECPRFARIPVVEAFPDTSCNPQVEDPDDPDKEDKCTARIVGFEWVYLLRPFFNGTNGPEGFEDANDFDNAGSGQTVRTIAAVAIDVSDAVVGGDCFSEYKEGSPKVIRLIGS